MVSKNYDFFGPRTLAAAFARRTAPGLGYGLIWNKGPEAVVSAPVRASLFWGKPEDQVPL